MYTLNAAFFGITLFVKYAQGAFLQSDKCETGTFLFPHFVYNTLQCLIYCTSSKSESVYVLFPFVCLRCFGSHSAE